MLSIKLRRVGKKGEPAFRLIVTDRKKDPWGDYLESVGFYNPRTTPKTITLNADRIKHWIGLGAQASGTIHNLLIDAKIVSGKKIKVTRAKKGSKKVAEEKKPAEPAKA